jgi:hypothetical protein
MSTNSGKVLCNELTGPDNLLKVNPYTGFPDVDDEVDETIDTSDFEGGKQDKVNPKLYSSRKA